MNINEIKIHVDELARSQAGAYASGEDFNRDVKMAQEMMVDYYINRHDHIDMISLSPFINEAPTPVSGGIITIPSDLRHIVNIDVVSPSIVDGVTKVNLIGAMYVNAVSVADSRRSSIRSGNAAKCRYIYYQHLGGFKIEPAVTDVNLRYIKQPPVATWGFTIDSVNLVENYDAITSIDPLWLEKDRTTLIDTILFIRGLRTSNSDIVQWLQFKKSKL